MGYMVVWSPLTFACIVLILPMSMLGIRTKMLHSQAKAHVNEQWGSLEVEDGLPIL